MIGVATLLVGLPASCHIAFRGFSWLGVLCRRRFSSVLSCGFPGSCSLPIASYVGVATIGVTTLGIAFLFCLVVSLWSWILSSPSDRRCDARRWFASVLSCAFAKFMFAIFGILCRRLNAWCRFVIIVSYGVSTVLMVWFGIEIGIPTVGVAKLSVRSIMSCCRTSQGSSTIHIWKLFSALRQ
jgi:hypothetical protein